MIYFYIGFFVYILLIVVLSATNELGRVHDEFGDSGPIFSPIFVTLLWPIFAIAITYGLFKYLGQCLAKIGQPPELTAKDIVKCDKRLVRIEDGGPWGEFQFEFLIKKKWYPVDLTNHPVVSYEHAQRFETEEVAKQCISNTVDKFKKEFADESKIIVEEWRDGYTTEEAQKLIDELQLVVSENSMKK